MEGLHLLADVAIADYQDCGDSPVKKKQKQEQRIPEINCCPLDQNASKFIDLNMLADVAAASSLLDAWDLNACSSVEKNKKPISNSFSVNATSSCWSLKVNKSNLKLCFKKTNKKSIVCATQTPKPTFSSHPIHLLAQVAFAYKTSTLWALCPNIIPTKRRSTFNWKPSKRFKHAPTTAMAGTKRRFADINTSQKEVEEEEIKTLNSYQRRRETRSLPIQLSNYLATKKGVSDPKLVIIKQLYGTDLNPQHCRFSIPVNQVIDRDFLTPEDERRLDNREAIRVTLIPPCLEEKPMHLKKWMMNGNGIYVLNNGWSSVIRNKKNRLHLHSTVELWSFTCNGGGLYFALTTGDRDIQTTIYPGSGRKDNSVDLNADGMEATSVDDESTITIHEDV